MVEPDLPWWFWGVPWGSLGVVLDRSRHFFWEKGVERPEQHHVSRHFFLEKSVDANGEPYKVSVGFDTFFQKKVSGAIQDHPQTPSGDTPESSRQIYMILYCTQLTYTILSCYILYCTILYHSMLYYAILWCTLLWYNCGDSIPTPSTTLCCTPVLRSLSRRWIWHPISLYDIVIYSIDVYIYIYVYYIIYSASLYCIILCNGGDGIPIPSTILCCNIMYYRL